MRDKLSEAQLQRGLSERLEQPSTNPAMLPGVDHENGDLCLVLAHTDELGQADRIQARGGGNLGDYGHAITAIDLRQRPPYRIGEPGPAWLERGGAALRREAGKARPPRRSVGASQLPHCQIQLRLGRAPLA